MPRQHLRSLPSASPPWRQRLRLTCVMLLMLVLAASGLDATAQRAPEARVELQVQGETIGIPLHFRGGRWESDPFERHAPDFNLLVLGLWLDPDPGIHAVIQAENLTSSPLSFAFLFETQITPAATVLDSSVMFGISSVGDGFVRGGGGGFGVLVRTTFDAYGLSLGAQEIPLSLGLNLVSALGDGQGLAPVSVVSHLVSATPSVALGSRLVIDLSARDLVTLETTVLQASAAPAVPEPGAALKMTLGLAALALGLRRGQPGITQAVCRWVRALRPKLPGSPRCVGG